MKFAKIKFTEKPSQGSVSEIKCVEAEGWWTDPGQHAQIGPDYREFGYGKTLAEAKSDAAASLMKAHISWMNEAQP
ncbi:MAG: hypothetical protein EOP87_00110 [Verrucomicrobiaceae bacterium]|nr:MAG: hypothetical protein EOP87_00110 [Verrucomicrobiaceae bacterium]